MVDVRKWYYKKRTTSLPSVSLAPESEAMLNLWRDFRKVVQFIDENKVWLMPLLERVKS